ncbi:MAG: MFS transporter [Burkholderiaceae bacterium]
MNSISPAPPAFLPAAQVRAVMTGLMIVVLLGAMDQTIVSVALPQMSGDLQGFSLLAWVVSGYLIATAVSMPIYGKLGDLYGRRNTLSYAIVIFLLASAACAMASSMEMLVGSRILQGIGGGGLISVAQAVVADVVSPRERGRYQGYFSTTYAVASVAGPLVGGLLTHYLSWRWVFWINLPLALAALVIARRTLSMLPVPKIHRRIDFGGAVLLTSALSALLVAITRAGQGMAWLSAENSLLFGASLVLLLAFVWQETRFPEPLIPLRLFKMRTVVICCVVAFIGFIQIVSLSVLIPLQMETLAGAGPREAAYGLIPFTLATPIGAYVAGKFAAYSARFKPLILVGNALAFAGLLGFAFSGVHAVFLNALLLAVVGFGIGMQLPSTMVGVQNAVLRQDTGVATATIAFVRSFGAAIGVAVLTAILLSGLRGNAPGLAASMSGAEILRGLIEGNLAAADPTLRQHLTLGASAAFRQIFLVSAFLGLVALGAGALLRNEKLHDKPKLE